MFRSSHRVFRMIIGALEGARFSRSLEGLGFPMVVVGGGRVARVRVWNMNCTCRYEAHDKLIIENTVQTIIF